MELQVEREDVGPCRVALTIQVPPEEVARRREQVFSRMARRIAVPGFRPGKAPRNLVSRFISQSLVSRETASDLIRSGYETAASQLELRPYEAGEPSLEVIEGLPEDPAEEPTGFRFKCTFSLQPIVRLGSLEDLHARRVVVKTTDDDVERSLREVAQSRFRYELKDGPAGEGDRVRCELEIVVDGEPVVRLGADQPVLLQVGNNLEFVDQALVGLSAGEERDFPAEFPEDYEREELRSKLGQGHVVIHAVLQRAIPEVDDALAQEVAGVDLAAWRELAREKLQSDAERLADSELEGALLAEVVRRSEVLVPDEHVSRTAAGMLQRLIARLEESGSTLEAFLRGQNLTYPQLQQSLLRQAEESVVREEVLRALLQHFEVRPDEAAIEEWVQRMVAGSEYSPAKARRILDQRGVLDDVRADMLIRNALSRLREGATIEEVEQ